MGSLLQKVFPFRAWNIDTSGVLFSPPQPSSMQSVVEAFHNSDAQICNSPVSKILLSLSNEVGFVLCSSNLEEHHKGQRNTTLSCTFP